MQSTSPKTPDTTDGSNATTLEFVDETIRHKLVVLEDVVERLQSQKKQVLKELEESQTKLEDVKAKLEAANTREREIVSMERRKHRAQIQELKEKLEAAETAQSEAQEKSREKFQHAKERAIEEHQKLKDKATRAEELLRAAQSKLDHYRKESYERETKLRQTLREEQEARRKLGVASEQAIDEAKQAKAAMAEQKANVEETLMISEAAVAAADRREANLKKALEEARAEIAALKANATINQEETSNNAELRKKAEEIQELQNQVVSMHQKFAAEQQRERQKWAKEIDALQEALEIARTKEEPPERPVPARGATTSKPNIIRRIRRKILHS